MASCGWDRMSRMFENSLTQWLIALGIAIVSFFILDFIRRVVVHRFEKLAVLIPTKAPDIIIETLKKTKLLFLFILALFFGAHFLTLPEEMELIIFKMVIIALMVQVGIWGHQLLNSVIRIYGRAKVDEGIITQTALNLISITTKCVFWVLVVLLLLDNLGYQITTLIAGLGIGGIAIAFAVQNILVDVFASFSIMIDKPFMVGDFIIVGDLLGTVEYIGIKTTRVRSLSGEQLVFSNNDLLNSRIRNYKRMFERRVVFTFRVPYNTAYGTVQTIPKMVKEIIESVEKTRFDRAHFKEYGEYSLVYEVVYYVLVPEYNIYMDIQQDINLNIFKKFEQEGIKFAYPTRVSISQK